MTRIKVQIDWTAYKTKPVDQHAGIKSRTQGSKPTEISISDLVRKIEHGHTVSPAVLSGGLKAIDFSHQQLVFVDIDNDNEGEPILTPEEALKICEANGISPAFYYPTFSSTPLKPKFRLALISETVITELSERNAVVEGLTSMFAQADKSCRNADKVFLGTNQKAVVWNEFARFTIEQAIALYVPPKPIARIQPTQSGDDDLERLKRDFDFGGYLEQRNGEINCRGTTYTQFKNCEICGARKCLTYYPETNSFMCFGARGNCGGSPIDYLMKVDNLNHADAIAKFKYELCKVEKPEFTKSQKRDYAIRKNSKAGKELVAWLKEIEPHGKYQWNDKGLGHLFADAYRNFARYNTTAQKWYWYNGKVWKADNCSMKVLQYAKDLYDALIVYCPEIKDDEKKAKYLEFINKLGKLGLRETMIKDARDWFPICQEDMDGDEYQFNCQNGTMDLKRFEFKSHDPNDLLTKISNVTYDLNAKSELFEKFMDDIMIGDSDKIAYLQKAFGYALTGDTRVEACFIMYGATTRNGKSTLIETLAYMQGSEGWICPEYESRNPGTKAQQG